jgi:CRP/FNR family transcriptional regulator, anaerobic regulatory protein
VERLTVAQAAASSTQTSRSEAIPVAACQHGRSSCADCKVRLLSVCAALDESELTGLEALSQPGCFAPRTPLFSEEQPADAVFNVTEGMVRLYKLLPDGRRQIVGFALPGDFLGLALLDRYGVSAEAVTETRACRFSRKAFAGYVDQKPHLLRRLHEFAGHELSLAQDQMVLLGRRSAEERVAAFLVGLRERMARTGHHSVTLPLPMSRQDIADFLGLTIETVSRTFTKLAKDKVLLVVPDGIRITNPEQLEAIARG